MQSIRPYGGLLYSANEDLERLRRKQCLGGLITSAILGAGAVVAYLVGLWPSIASIASKIISLVVASTLVPNWLLAPVCLMALFGAYALFVMLYPHRTGPDWRDYQEDTFFDMVWRWRYDRTNSIGHLKPFCPRCDTQLLQIRNSSMPYHPYHTVYHCRRCDSPIKISMLWSRKNGHSVKQPEQISHIHWD